MARKIYTRDAAAEIVSMLEDALCYDQEIKALDEYNDLDLIDAVEDMLLNLLEQHTPDTEIVSSVFDD